MDKLTLYHALPYAAKTAIASMRGLQLRKWRYGPETEDLVAAVLERERWPASRLREWQQSRLAEHLNFAAKHVPYYRDHWQQRRRDGDRASWEVLQNWPVLHKESVRQHPEAFLPDTIDPRRMSQSNTSGTSGKPLRLWQTREGLHEWYALFEARARRWYGVSRFNRWAIFGGQLVAPTERRKPPFWVWNAPLRQLYASSYHLAPDLIPAYARALAEYRIEYLLGYTSSLYTLAQEVIAQRLELPPLRVVLTNAEPLYSHQRDLLTKAFGCPVRETYGMSEMAGAASECEYGRMHFWSDAGVVEVLEDGEPAPPGNSGEIVLTGFVNRGMPLVRYRVGDRGSLSASSACECGRGLPLLQGIEGRNDDVVYTRDGRRVGRLDPVFKGNLPVKEVQIVQETLDCIRIVYVPADGFGQAAEDSIRDRLRQRLGPVQVEFEPVTAVPRGANGKFRAVVSKVAGAAAVARR